MYTSVHTDKSTKSLSTNFFFWSDPDIISRYEAERLTQQPRHLAAIECQFISARLQLSLGQRYLSCQILPISEREGEVEGILNCWRGPPFDSGRSSTERRRISEASKIRWRWWRPWRRLREPCTPGPSCRVSTDLRTWRQRSMWSDRTVGPQRRPG